MFKGERRNSPLTIDNKQQLWHVFRDRIIDLSHRYFLHDENKYRTNKEKVFRIMEIPMIYCQQFTRQSKELINKWLFLIVIQC